VGSSGISGHIRSFLVAGILLGLSGGLFAQASGRERAIDDALNSLATVLATDIAKAKASTVGVLEFGDAEGKGGGAEAILGKYVSWALTPLLMAHPSSVNLSVVDRAFIAKVLSEQEFGLSGSVANPVAFGQLLSCQILVTGTIIPMGAEAYAIAAKAVSVETGGIVSSFSKRISLTPDVAAFTGREATDEGAGKRLGSQPEAAYGISVIGAGGAKRRYEKDGIPWVLAKPGEQYSIEIRNDTDRRVGVALLVDGINTAFMRRETPSEAVKWIVPPRSRVVIPGWQVDANKARSFVFSGKAESLAVSLGKGEEVGLISASFFPEELSPPKNGTQEAGTAAGSSIESRVQEVSLYLEPRAVRVAVLRYDYRAGLAARGIDARE